MSAFLKFSHKITSSKVQIGVVIAKGISTVHHNEAFEQVLARVIEKRRQPLEMSENALREAVRDMLRNGKYKPTGRGKPASEYLIRAAENDTFPRINAPVDINNLVSLDSLLPISLWDIDLAKSDEFVFRLGELGESYIFNTGGQQIEVQDLIVGCRVTSAFPNGEPIVNPIKDSLATKTTPETRFIAAAIYAPTNLMSSQSLEEECAKFAFWLQQCGEHVHTQYAILQQDESIELSLA